MDVLAQQAGVSGHQRGQGIELHDTPGETSSEKGRPREDLTVYSYLIRGFTGNATRFFLKVPGDRSSGYGQKLKHTKFLLDTNY